MNAKYLEVPTPSLTPSLQHFQIHVRMSRVKIMACAKEMQTRSKGIAVNVGNVQILKTQSWYVVVIAGHIGANAK